LSLALGAAFLLGALVLHVNVAIKAVGVSLDGSRRWVTLSGVHPDFARAVELHEAEARRP